MGKTMRTDAEIREAVQQKLDRIIDDALEEACESVAASMGLDPDLVQEIYEDGEG